MIRIRRQRRFGSVKMSRIRWDVGTQPVDSRGSISDTGRDRSRIASGVAAVDVDLQRLHRALDRLELRIDLQRAAVDHHGALVVAMLAQGEKVHPQYRNLVEKGISVAWHRMDHMLGCSARWGQMTSESEAAYSMLQSPLQGRHFYIGDQISRHSAWMESALQSAKFSLAEMDRLVRAEEASA